MLISEGEAEPEVYWDMDEFSMYVFQERTLIVVCTLWKGFTVVASLVSFPDHWYGTHTY